MTPRRRHRRVARPRASPRQPSVAPAAKRRPRERGCGPGWVTAARRLAIGGDLLGMVVRRCWSAG